ncbi:hypothetical protein [Enterococcus rivorum]|uniref:Uncharacterized protein n=1 Tax=Enterococcus rivorum TaxID=762845 RepID=A0A1E5KU34_9ENTE|nr:hypothetical protein [Enterococcus rivorum]MBP2098424.1 hypothetical protein [Enterococcus rivorum]OEH81366.1 hypothetical protein BCR26_16780 [Enterococcus rivorum]
MKKKNVTIILLCGLFLLVGTQLIYLSTMLNDSNFYMLILFLFGIPIVYLFILMLIIGYTLQNRNITVAYAVIYSTVFSVISNLLPMFFLNDANIKKLVENTNVQEGVTINIGSGISFGQVLSTVFLYIVIAGVAGLMGNKFNRKKR